MHLYTLYVIELCRIILYAGRELFVLSHICFYFRLITLDMLEKVKKKLITLFHVTSSVNLYQIIFRIIWINTYLEGLFKQGDIHMVLE